MFCSLGGDLDFFPGAVGRPHSRPDQL